LAAGITRNDPSSGDFGLFFKVQLVALGGQSGQAVGEGFGLGSVSGAEAEARDGEEQPKEAGGRDTEKVPSAEY
jgi:hypothetical protein